MVQGRECCETAGAAEFVWIGSVLIVEEKISLAISQERDAILLLSTQLLTFDRGEARLERASQTTRERTKSLNLFTQ